MCDASRLYLFAEPLEVPPFSSPPPCDACDWPDGYAVAFSPATGCFVLCSACCERLSTATLLAFALAAAFRGKAT